MDSKEKFEVAAEKLKYLLGLEMNESIQIEEIKVFPHRYSRNPDTLIGYQVEIVLNTRSYHYIDEVIKTLTDIRNEISRLSRQFIIDDKFQLRVNPKDLQHYVYDTYVIDLEINVDDENVKVKIGYEVELS